MKVNLNSQKQHLSSMQQFVNYSTHQHLLIKEDVSALLAVGHLCLGYSCWESSPEGAALSSLTLTLKAQRQ